MLLPDKNLKKVIIDIFGNFEFDYDKRNQKYKPSSGYISNYDIQIPLIIKTNTLTNSYLYKVYGELYDNNVTSLSVFLKTANSIQVMILNCLREYQYHQKC